MIKILERIIIFSIIASSSISYSAVHTALHTEYIDKHKHEDLYIVKVESPSSLPFATLLQLYEFEFVPYTHKEVDPNGRYEQDIWSDNGVDIYVLYCGSTPIGFAVVNCASMLSGAKDVHDIAEFFIMPSHRRIGCGTQFAHEIFNKYPGKWEIREIENHPAIRTFWRKVISGYVGDKFTDQDMNSAEWVGSLQAFNTHDRIVIGGKTFKKDSAQLLKGGNQYSYILKASPGKGIGVFALHTIPAGAPITDRATFKIKICKRNEVPQELVGHCTHLGSDDEIAPERFDQMPIFWYLNHSDAPNVAIRGNIAIAGGEWLIMDMYALKDIQAGDELFCDYNAFGEPEETKENFYQAKLPSPSALK